MILFTVDAHNEFWKIADKAFAGGIVIYNL